MLKAEGRLILGFLDRTSPLGRTYEAHKKEHRFYQDARFYSADEVARFVADVEFADIAFCQTVFDATLETPEPDAILPGYGKGAFVVLNARKATNMEEG